MNAHSNEGAGTRVQAGTPVPGLTDEAAIEALVKSFDQDDGGRAVDLSGYGAEDWFSLGLFWLMAALVFLQFFSRYVLNDSYAWTEELAVYSLIGVVFIGSAGCVRTNRHIQVDILYRIIPAGLARVLATVVDILRTAFLAYGCWLVYQYISLVGFEPMTTVMWNKSYVYWLVLAGFVLMTLRSFQVSWQNWRRQSSQLERPEDYDILGS